MQTIPVQKVYDAEGRTIGQQPEWPIPTTALHVVCNGDAYVVYEAGDTLPQPPEQPPEQPPL